MRSDVRLDTKRGGPGFGPGTAPTPRLNRSDMQSTEEARQVRQIGLIRSLAAWSDGNEAQTLDEILAVLDGATLEQISARRAA